MECVCDLKKYTGEKKDLICVLDVENSKAFWPDEDALVYLQNLLDGKMLAIYRKENPE